MSDLLWKYWSDLLKSEVCNIGGVKNTIDRCRPEVCQEIGKIRQWMNEWMNELFIVFSTITIINDNYSVFLAPKHSKLSIIGRWSVALFSSFFDVVLVVALLSNFKAFGTFFEHLNWPLSGLFLLPRMCIPRNKRGCF